MNWVKVRSILLKESIATCQIPEDWGSIIEEMVTIHIHALKTSLCNLELIYRRTLTHAEELKIRERTRIDYNKTH